MEPRLEPHIMRDLCSKAIKDVCEAHNRTAMLCDNPIDCVEITKACLAGIIMLLSGAYQATIQTDKEATKKIITNMVSQIIGETFADQTQRVARLKKALEN